MIEILTNIGSAVSILKTVREIAEPMNKSELKLALANLTEQLADIKMKAIELAEENAELKREVGRLSKPPEMVYRDGAYYNGDDGPYCPTCYDQGKKVRMQKFPEIMRTFGNFRCNTCKTAIE
jgi:hypothetical protein